MRHGNPNTPPLFAMNTDVTGGEGTHPQTSPNAGRILLLAKKFPLVPHSDPPAPFSCTATLQPFFLPQVSDHGASRSHHVSPLSSPAGAA